MSTNRIARYLDADDQADDRREDLDHDDDGPEPADEWREWAEREARRLNLD